MNEAYASQDRGDHSAYDRYLRGMDMSMRQKVALTAAHLLCLGEVADMGMGSGTGSHALASLYPSLKVTGVDVNPQMVARAHERYGDLPNLSFREGDIATPVFPPGSLAGVFDSSVLHHVTTFNGYDHDAAARCLRAQADMLTEHGVLIVRDFLTPEDPEAEVWLDLPTDDGDGGDDPRGCSSAALLERFAREFCSLRDPGQRGFPLAQAEPTAEAPVRPGWRRYRLGRKHAVEFVLRKDYRRDWEDEVQEEYTYFTQTRFETLFAELGLRVVASAPIRNPWILRNRFWGKFELRDASGQDLEDPPTNYIIVGERAPAGEGVRLQEGAAHARLGFLELDHYRHRESGQVFDLVRRPHLTVDILPWYRQGQDLFVLARKSYPRPILTCERGQTPLVDGSRAVGYVTEPLAVLQDDKPLGQTVEEALAERASLPSEALHGFREGAGYYPSPGGIQEEVRALLVEVDPVWVERETGSSSGFSTSGAVRAIEARQLLRAAQVGGLPNARLEINVYDLLRQLGEAPGPWIGETIELAEGRAPERVHRMRDLEQRPARRQFLRADPAQSPGFLAIRCAEFEELDAQGQVLHRRPLEFVLPQPLSFNTIALAPLLRVGERVFLGLDDDDLPAAQCFGGNSQLLVTPAWRLPHSLTSPTPARAWARDRLAETYGLELGQTWELGGTYHPSPGVTPEVVFPYAVEVLSEGTGGKSVTWVELTDLLQHPEQLRDGHLRTLAFRAGHALGALGGEV